ncbi:cytidylyltransferase domain-containing protein [Massilia sp. LC238]|uniref:acylneuraminate cytidylyltransferase family protein n=1 Tax=Massilia sp. LC238 TaxID=1502852 RepID=UPI0004E3DEBB|nr:acylneuraminate cytidylyltransferase family protein [Massilia sp. LC238]KFC69468.1 CMP-N-acetylneuraminic acid synthetase [Massilia sp. LC238]
MSVFAFTFARGGSKGLPGKNIKELGGIPLIAHSLLLARRMPGIDGVFVSTDCDEIARVAREQGAEVIMRPAELATDNAPEWLAWQHAIRHVQDSGRSFDVFLSLPSTSPLRSEVDVDACIGSLDADTDVVITVTPASRNPYFNMVVRDAEGGSRIVLGEGNTARRQEAPEVFDITTVAYVARPWFILNHKKLFDGRVKSVVVPKERAVDIDDAVDFQLAEILYQNANDSAR